MENATLNRLLLAVTLLAPMASFAQAQNALDFDGVNDEVLVNNASAQIANATGFSLTCWVYPTQNANWPNMEAIAGFRDNLLFDFYLLQTYGTTMEGRFRNSANQIVTLDSTAALTLNAWQFVALTFDGSMLRMYRDAQLLGEAPATGTVTTTTGTFRIGNMPIPGSTQIYLDGQVEEVGLWGRGLTAAELECIRQYGADTGDDDLRLYYRMNQGMAGGSNAGITMLTDAAGNLNGTLSGFALNGASSNFVQGLALSGSVSAQICPDEAYDFNGQQIMAPGTYTALIPTPSGCDSTVTLTLTQATVNVGVTQTGHVLLAQATGATFQWMNCLTGAIITNAISPLYTATANGQYAVIVTQNGCVDTSACVNVVTAGIDDLRLPTARVWPQPASDQLNVELSSVAVNATLRVADILGRTVLARSYAQVQRTTLDVAKLPTGAYLMVLEAGGERRVVRFAKE